MTLARDPGIKRASFEAARPQRAAHESFSWALAPAGTPKARVPAYRVFGRVGFTCEAVGFPGFFELDPPGRGDALISSGVPAKKKEWGCPAERRSPL